MKTQKYWDASKPPQHWASSEHPVIERELPKVQPNFLSFECVYGAHKADLLHRGTAYCRSCYDEKSRLGTLIDY